MKVSVEAKKVEALKRMEFLKIYPPIREAFRKSGKVARCDPPFGAHFWLEDEEKEIVAGFEKKNDALVYMAIRTYADIGTMTSYLYVSDHEDEWDLDRDDLANSQAVAYVYNHDDPDMSELGSIGIVPTPAAGLRRIW